MKIAFAGLELPEGKTKYNDPIVQALTGQFQPAKVSPFYFEFIAGDFKRGEAIAISASQVLDLLILDMERLEGRMERTADAEERDLLSRGMQALEDETPLCDLPLDEHETALLRTLGPLSLKPTVVFDAADTAPDVVIPVVLKKARRMFFYTAGKQEVHAWLVEEGADAVTCAGQIHSDLARGFIKAEIVSAPELMATHNFESARREGRTRLVDADFKIEPETVLDIRFNV